MLKNLSLNAIVLALLISGCASTSVRHYTVEPTGAIDIAEERKDTGVRFYENAPYVLVYATGEAYRAELIYIPDTTTVFTAKPENLLAVNNSALTFSDGVLTEASITVDTIAIPKAIITAAKELALGIAPGALNPNDTKPAPRAILYKIAQDTHGGPKLLSAEAIY